VPTLGRNYRPPYHLGPLIEALELSLHQEVRRTAHAPPRHGKTDSVLAFIAYALRAQPWRTFGYFTYADRLARSKSRKARAWALAQGLELASDSRNLNEWRTTQGGGLLVGGAGGPLTGQGIDGVLFVDDPYKNRADAESAAYRSKLNDWWDDVGETRLEPGASAFIFHTRWTGDDLIGHIHGGENAEEWSHIHLPAISSAGLPLWPERWPLEQLLRKQKAVGEYTWASLYQGTPRPRGMQIFGDVHYYDVLPPGFRVCIGIDLAYSAKTSSDYSVAVVLAEVGGVYYVLDVVRLQVRAPDFGGRLARLREAWPGAPVHFYGAGTELGTASFLQRDGIPVVLTAATVDKLARSESVSAAWNAGRVLVPRKAAWLVDFVAELVSFTGIRDLHDDQVDALAAAFALLVVNDDGGVIRVRVNHRHR
jgi:predicted phage terminase large subunit-like protein